MSALDLAGQSQIYEAFYGLVEAPFGPDPDPRFFFESHSHRATLDLILGTSRQAESAVIVAGDSGTGKTMLCRVALERVPARTFLALVPSALVDRAAFFAAILEQFGIISADQTLPDGDALVAALQQFLGSLPVLQASAVIIVDNAQEIRPELLAEIHGLTNAEPGAGRRLRIVLLGEPALLELLATSNHSLLARTSDARVLTPLGADEVAPYIERRLTIARGSPMPDLTRSVSFSRDAAAAIAACSGGVPGTANALCHHALEDACTRGKRVVDQGAVMAAAERLEIPVALTTRLRPYRAAAVAAAVVIAAAVTWVTIGESPSEDSSSAPAQTQTTSEPGAPEPASLAGTVSPPPAPAAVPVVNATLQRAESFTVLVASFRTTSRAQATTDAIVALDLPGYMRTVQDGWQSVVVGPYFSRDEADAARQRLEAAQFAGTRVLSTPSTDAEPGLTPSSAVARAVLLPVTGRTTIAIDLAAEPNGASVNPGLAPLSAEVDIGPLPGQVEDRDLVPADPGVVERVSVRGVPRGATTTARMTVTMREPGVASVRRDGRRVYVDLTYAAKPSANGSASADAPPTPPSAP